MTKEKTLQDKILKSLSPLIQLPLWSMGRAGSMVWCSFGYERREVLNRRGSKKIVSEFALHIQGSWRVQSSNKILFGSNDKFYPPKVDLTKEFDWASSKNTLLDKNMESLMKKSQKKPLIVTDIYSNYVGDIRITLSNKYFLEIYPTASTSEEFCRLFTPYSEKKHVVFYGVNVKLE